MDANGAVITITTTDTDRTIVLEFITRCAFSAP